MPALDDKNARVATKVVITSAAGLFQDASGRLWIRCTKCLEAKPLEAFGLRYMEPDDGGEGYLGSQPQCIKPCRS